MDMRLETRGYRTGFSEAAFALLFHLGDTFLKRDLEKYARFRVSREKDRFNILFLGVSLVVAFQIVCTSEKKLHGFISR